MTAAVSPLARLDRYWRGPAPAERLAALRILVGGFALCCGLAIFSMRWADAHHA